jgi:hypothetical protein
MRINWTAVIGGTILTAAIGAVPIIAHASAPDVIVTAKVREHPDNGHGSPAHWATDSFTRTMRIHATGPNAFELTTTDTGTFTTIKGAGRPAGHGGTISRIVTGAFAGSGKGTATGALVANPASLSGRTFDDVHGTPFPGSGAWANEFFGSGATVSPFGGSYSFSYKTADEKWVDASDNGDGTDPAAGDITGKLSSLLVINPCHARRTTVWRVTNARGDRSRTFTYWSYYKGQKSAGAKATVAPGATVTLHTATSTTLGMHYYNGEGVSKWGWVHCPR